jgi:hypothetical protein
MEKEIELEINGMMYFFHQNSNSVTWTNYENETNGPFDAMHLAMQDAMKWESEREGREAEMERRKREARKEEEIYRREQRDWKYGVVL